MNAESELEAVGMAWGAAATGTPAATGSTGQGLSLMQESLSEITMARLPLVVLNMARAQGDYFQSTRGGGHGDYRHIVLAPSDVPEAVQLSRRPSTSRTRWRNPVLVFGDYYLAHTARSVTSRHDRPPTRPSGRSTDVGRVRPRQAGLLLGTAKQRDDVGYDLADALRGRRAATERMCWPAWSRGSSRLHRRRRAGGGRIRHAGPLREGAVRELRAEGIAVGFVRPITLFPFPTEVVAAAAAGAPGGRRVREQSGADDRRRPVGGARPAPVHFIGGLSLDSSGFGIAPDLEVGVLKERIRVLGSVRGPHDRRPVPPTRPPATPARLVDDFMPALIDGGAHHLCPGCGEPVAMRSTVEAVAELDLIRRAIAVFGIGCYTAFSNNLDVEVLQALHGRALRSPPGSSEPGPDAVVLTVQGDGDMVSEGLQEVLHTAARGEKVTCIMLNNGVFGETGGHMTATTVLGQRTKTSLEGATPTGTAARSSSAR